MPSGTVDPDAAFLAHWLRAQPAVAAWALLRLGDRQAVDDVLQEVALAAWRAFDRYDAARPFTTWALGIAHHKVVDHLRRHGARAALIEADGVAALDRMATTMADDLHDRALAMQACVAALAPRGRILVQRFYAEEQPLAAIADALGLSVGAVKVRLHRLRLALRACVERRLGRERSPA